MKLFCNVSCVFIKNNSSLFLPVNPALPNTGSSDMPYALSHGSPQTPSRERFLSEPERFTFGSVSTERETEEESSSCFDYTSDQVRQFLDRYACFEFSSTGKEAERLLTRFEISSSCDAHA